MNRLEKQKNDFIIETDKKPARVFLFSGHTIDRKNRPIPRFPEAMEAEARQKIEQILDTFQASAKDLAIAPGIACGGDILFLEACLLRNIDAIVFLPFEPARFIEESVRYAGDKWVERFHNIKNHPQVTINIMPSIDKISKKLLTKSANNQTEWYLYVQKCLPFRLSA